MPNQCCSADWLQSWRCHPFIHEMVRIILLWQCTSLTARMFLCCTNVEGGSQVTPEQDLVVLHNCALQFCFWALQSCAGAVWWTRSCSTRSLPGSITCSTVTVLRNLPVRFTVGLEKGMMSPHYTLLTSLARAGISFYPPMFCDSEGKKTTLRRRFFWSSGIHQSLSHPLQL